MSILKKIVIITVFPLTKNCARIVKPENGIIQNNGDHYSFIHFIENITCEY